MAIQMITAPDGEELVVMPRADYERLVEFIEDAFDDDEAAGILARIHGGEEATFSEKEIMAIMARRRN
jgi:hypothetical protein